MTKILLILTLWAGAAGATSFRLDDPKILGEYVLAKADKRSEVQTAQIRYDADNQLVIDFRDDDEGFPLSNPDKKGVILDYQDEPNCDGDEQACYYDAQISVTLGSTVNKKGVEIPQLTIEITSVNAYDEKDAGETTTYVLNWSREIPNAIAYYTNVPNPAQLTNLVQACEKVVEPTIGYGGISNAGDICTRPATVKLRDPLNEAMTAYIEDQGGRGVRVVSATELESLVFAPALEVIKKYDVNEIKVPQAALLAEAVKMQKYIVANSDAVYYHQYVYWAVLYIVNSKTKLVTSVYIRNQR